MEPVEATERSSVPSKWGVVLVLFLSFALYLPSVGNKFAMDDDPIAKAEMNTQPGVPDPVVTSFHDQNAWAFFTKFFTNHYWWPEQYNDGLFRPISSMSYALVYHAFGQWLAKEYEAVPQHAVNVLVHVWAVWLVIRLLVVVGASGFVTLLTGLLFGVHAIHSEVVAGIIGRAEMFSFCFGAQAVVLMFGAGIWRPIVAGVLMFCAFGSKESSVCWVPFFFCVALARHWLRDPGADRWAPLRPGSVAVPLAVLLVPCGLCFLLRHFAIHHHPDPLMEVAADFSSNPLALEPVLPRVLTAIKVWGFALWLCFFPYPLSCIYSPFVFEVVRSPADPGFLASAVALGAFLVAGLWFARQLPLLFLGMTCFLGFSFITSNVPFPIGTILGERLYYTPSLGACILPGVLWPFLRGRGRQVFLVLVSLWMAGSAVWAAKRTGDWYDSASIFFTDVETYPMAIDLHRKSAAVYESTGPRQDLDKALSHLDAAIELMPDYVHAYRQKAKIFETKKKWREAIAMYERALACDYVEPAGAEALAFHGVGENLMKLAGEADEPAERKKLVDEAIAWIRKSLDVPPFGDTHGDAYNKIGRIHLFLREKAKDPKEQERLRQTAMSFYRRTLDLKGNEKAKSTAYRQIFLHCTQPRPLYSQAQLRKDYESAWKLTGQEPTMFLAMGTMAYQAGLPMEWVYEALHSAIMRYPEDKKGAAFYQAHLMYSEALAERGEKARARQILMMLLQRSEITMTQKNQIRQMLANDPRLR